MGLHGPPDAEVIHRENIRTLELEHQVHLYGPPAKTLDPGPVRNDLLIRSAIHRFERGGGVQAMLRQTAQIAVFLSTHPK